MEEPTLTSFKYFTFGMRMDLDLSPENELKAFCLWSISIVTKTLYLKHFQFFLIFSSWEKTQVLFAYK